LPLNPQVGQPPNGVQVAGGRADPAAAQGISRHRPDPDGAGRVMVWHLRQAATDQRLESGDRES
jgi:hypothetical protein